MSQLDDKLNSVMILNKKIKLGKGEGQKTLRTPYSCTRYTAITQKYKLGKSSNILMYISFCPPEWYQMVNFGYLAHRLQRVALQLTWSSIAQVPWRSQVGIPLNP